jgi:hypothetical protein
VNELALHVGLMKSGTTSVQRALYTNRARLTDAGVDYVDLGQYNQMLWFAELLAQDPYARSRFPSGLRRHLHEMEPSTSGMWRRLVDAVADSTMPRVVLSAENLVYAGPTTLERLAAAFSMRRLRVVITHRPA